MFSPKKALYFLFVFLVLSQCKGASYEPAPNCGRLECPPYSVVQSGKEFEIRSYKDALWLSGPKVMSKSYTFASDKSFLVLLQLVRINRNQNVKINMTAPALVDVQNSTYQVFFYLPQTFQSGLPIPQPNSREIEKVTLPKHKYAAVKRFGGFITDFNIPKQIEALRKSLQGTPYQRAAAIENFTIAGYNSPFELINRVNEVIIWFD
ncbi:hypothetical protein DH2020_039487 [Rehmannia glutinosa]|uniref:SOUL heme-binding protein n=1 Tax=Rehmannia glutinosa TaxID=99300 RepID=A0ABR0UWV6_REHGL